MKDCEHKCELLPESGVHIHLAEDYLDNGDYEWCLVIERIATAEDLENNHCLEEEGDLIWQTALGILACPFCGELLPGERRSVLRSNAEAKHLDFSGWSVRVR